MRNPVSGYYWDVEALRRGIENPSGFPLEDAIERGQRNFRRRLKRRLPIAEAYEAERRALWERVGAAEAEQRWADLTEALSVLTNEIHPVFVRLLESATGNTLPESHYEYMANYAFGYSQCY